MTILINKMISDNKLKEIDIKNHTQYCFDDSINIKNFLILKT